ncbi:ADP-ribosylation factor-binding protein GGA3 isoform X3 [Oryzias latipes]|uniref:ADP-ribosylation factor-binding protein GGA3 isoform X3 n=1 Tax=Oryzias latipes TaxID=8090 RepID=UPI000CE1C3B8|nr:ADP-ribosylation factor-binding protein GGA3 isoform X3 [Oryzias latipes]
MASSGSRETLESWLNKATDPNNEGDRWDCIQGFYQLVNEETNGPQVATRLLAHKIQSPQEKEALQALTVLEACMNNCGKRFHTEAAKFRFLNELIKILTPKYFGAWTPQQVKDRVTEVLYGWTLWLKEEPKIQQAYSMLKKQGIVKGDPKLSDTLVMPPPPQRTTESIFDQEDKAKLLTRLLKSGHPKDLETANRLIKNTIKEEQEKAEKASKRESTLKEVESCTKQLRELLDQHVVNGATFQPSNDVKALYERCDRLRPNLFRLASDTMDDDEALTQILAANDELTLTVNAYKDLVGRGSVNGRRVRNKTPTSPTATKSYHLIDLSALDSPKPHRKADLQPEFESSLFFSSVENTFFTGADEDLSEMDFDKLGTKQSQDGPKSYYTELMQLNEDIQMRNSEQNGGKGPTLRARGCGGTSAASNGTNIRSLPHTQSTSQKLLSDSSASPWKREESCCAPKSLNHIFVPLETIKSSPLEPVILYNQGGIHVSLHFASNCPPANPGVAVVVMSAVNTSALPVKDFSFQVAVPKSMSVKLQPASGTHLLPFNPLHPPSSVSQVLLLANPQSCKVRLRYKLTLTHGDKHLNEAAEIDSFPDWNSLIGC